MWLGKLNRVWLSLVYDFFLENIESGQHLFCGLCLSPSGLLWNMFVWLSLVEHQHLNQHKFHSWSSEFTNNCNNKREQAESQEGEEEDDEDEDEEDRNNQLMGLNKFALRTPSANHPQLTGPYGPSQALGTENDASGDVSRLGWSQGCHKDATRVMAMEDA